MTGTMNLEYAEEGKLPPQTEDRTFLFHVKTAFLITKSDVKTTILPATTFAFTAAYSGVLSTEPTPDFVHVLFSLLKSVLWTWMNLWIFNLSNQRLPNSVLEDSINKPWRAIPSGRLTSEEARRLLLISIPAVFLATLYLGGSKESLFLMVLTWIYNDLGAAEEHFLIRHVNNALGFTTFGAGAAQVACGTLNTTTYYWLAIIATAITCTIQFQDMEDQEGDRMRLRRTLPIVLGDFQTRRINALTILAFSIVAPAFWQLSLAGYVLPIVLGSSIAIRTLIRKDLAADKQTFKLWCLWLMLLYVLPFAKNQANVVDAWLWFW
ncbi:UbiA prenyltransferase family [Leptodontidium sp. 2 PMI_412]|nr:UbiA prenyltransferase family [Leptodontidium sp. MPI-SDFR-AT-0119]KAH9211977.1 UbiA prenyltransferase family [Leptodontidium sp. 2 PMI_412]